MQAYRIETTLTQDGTLTVSNLPLRAGEAVEIIILVQPPVGVACQYRTVSQPNLSPKPTGKQHSDYPGHPYLGVVGARGYPPSGSLPQISGDT